MDPHLASLSLASLSLDAAPSRAVAPLLAAATSPSRLAVAREMLETLETLTNAGQRHLMAKVVTFIQGHVSQAAPIARERPRAALFQHLTELQRQAERPSPDLAAFRSHAQALLGLLAPLG
jgi:hypothetical protein